MVRASAADNSQLEGLFLSLAEQVKLPFVQVTHAAELMQGNTSVQENKQTIIEVSQAAVRLIDGFMLSVKLQNEQQLNLEPVPVSSLLYDTAQILDGYAKMHDCELRLEVAGKYEPVMANSVALQYALANLGYSFIGAAREEKQKIIKLAVKRTRSGISAGVFGEVSNISGTLLTQAKQLRGKVHQPFTQFTSDNAAGVFVADSLFEALGSSMKVAKSGGMTGLAASFLPSRQLSLV